jgi:DNA-binding NtrC family response regulator
MFIITAKSDALKGLTWLLDDKPLSVGRSSECAIHIEDNLVSRVHCWIYLEGRAIRLVDLGSRNATLVNGVPIEDCVLEVGDEFSVGSTAFMLTSMSDGGEVLQKAAYTGKTTTVSALDPALLRDNVDGPRRGDAKTIYDLISTFNLGKALCATDSMANYLEVLSDQIEKRFSPGGVYFATTMGEGEPEPQLCWGTCAPPNSLPPRDSVRGVLADQSGLLIPNDDESEQGLPSVLMVPLIMASKSIAILCVRADEGQKAYNAADLDVLVAFAHAASAPLFAALISEQLRKENEELRRRTEGVKQALLGDSACMQALRQTLLSAGESDLNTLLIGDTGTGKEMSASLAHEHSGRREEPFIVLNCAAIPSSLFESELFGYEKGAFSGADRLKRGRIEQADKGTLFLDEVGDLSLDNQARLLRVIETGIFHRVGGEREVSVDVRIISATNKNLAAATTSGAFRLDLYHRLNAIEVHLPPLEDRRSDIPLMAEHFLVSARENMGKAGMQLAPEALDYLRSRDYPGNVRELHNLIHRAVALCATETIMPSDLGSANEAPKSEGPPQLFSLAAVERQHIGQVVEAMNGNVSAAARVLKISRSSLYSKLAEFGR